MLNSKEIQIGPAEWELWKNNPVTREFFLSLTREREEWAQRLVEGDTLHFSSMASIAAETGKAVGAVYGLDTALIGIEEVLKSQWQEARERREQGGE